MLSSRSRRVHSSSRRSRAAIASADMSGRRWSYSVSPRLLASVGEDSNWSAASWVASLSKGRSLVGIGMD